MSLSTEPTSRSTRFAVNVFWNWLGVGVALIFGFLLSPYLIRKLGADGYGAWTLAFSLIEYYWLTDLGFRAATVKYVAHYSATGELDKLREVMSTGLLYATAAALLILISVCALLLPYLDRFFKISPAYRSQFPWLMLLVTVSWCLGVVFNLFGAALDGVQRFDLTNRAGVVGNTIRTLGTALLLYFGYGLIALGAMVMFSQGVIYFLYYRMFRQRFPGQDLAPRHASGAMLRQMGKFGIHVFVATIGNQSTSQMAPVLIGHFDGATFSGYYSLPVRLLQYTVEIVGRIGMVTNTNAAELAAKSDSEALRQLAVFPNRYCLVLFMPLAILLWTYGDQIFRRWVGADFAAHSSPLLPILLAGNVVAVVGQYSSSMLLQGLGTYDAYARGMMVEALMGLVTLIFVIPRYGLLGAAIVTVALMILNRAIYTSWLTSRVVSLNFVTYIRVIYGYALLSAIPSFVLLWWLRRSVLPGNSWLQLGEAGVAAASYYAIAWFTCIMPAHKVLIQRVVNQHFPRLFNNKRSSAK